MNLRLPGVGDLAVALARRMHHVCAEVAGCYAKSANLPVRLGSSVTISACVGRPSTMVDNFDSIRCVGIGHRGWCPP